MMFIGIILANVLLVFGLMMAPLLTHFKSEVMDSKIANYQYILKAPVDTDTKMQRNIVLELWKMITVKKLLFMVLKKIQST